MSVGICEAIDDADVFAYEIYKTDTLVEIEGCKRRSAARHSTEVVKGRT